MSLDASGSRVNVMLRLIGAVMVGLGATLTYLTYQAAAQANLVPQIVPVFYLGAILLILIGVVAITAKYKN
jgi:hypothetical protein